MGENAAGMGIQLCAYVRIGLWYILGLESCAGRFCAYVCMQVQSEDDRKQTCVERKH